jgi:hypothetical protein
MSLYLGGRFGDRYGKKKIRIERNPMISLLSFYLFLSSYIVSGLLYSKDDRLEIAGNILPKKAVSSSS